MDHGQALRGEISAGKTLGICALSTEHHSSERPPLAFARSSPAREVPGLSKAFKASSRLGQSPSVIFRRSAALRELGEGLSAPAAKRSGFDCAALRKRDWVSAAAAELPSDPPRATPDVLELVFILTPSLGRS